MFIVKCKLELFSEQPVHLYFTANLDFILFFLGKFIMLLYKS